MATNFYKVGGSYYRSDTGAKVLNLADLQTLAKAGGKEVSAPASPSSVTPSAPAPAPAYSPQAPAVKKATLYGPNNQATVVDVGSGQASNLQSQGWGLTPGSYRSPTTPTIAPAVASPPQVPPAPTINPGSNKDSSGVDQTGWTDAMKQSFGLLEKKVNDLASAGKVINPNIAIDQKTIDRFTTQARTELEPYYKQTFAQLDTDLKTAVQKQKDEYGNAIRDIGLSYGKGLETTQQNYANRGLEFSSDRAKSEQEIKDEAARKVEEAAKATQQNVQSIGTDTERKLGSSLMPNLGTLETGYSMQSGPGQYGLGSATGTRSLFSATPGTAGTLERQRLFEEESRKNELIANERDYRSSMYL